MNRFITVCVCFRIEYAFVFEKKYYIIIVLTVEIRAVLI